MDRAIVTALVTVAAFVGPALGEVTVRGDRAVFRTEGLEAAFRGGTVVSLVNRATGESYLGPEAAGLLTAIRFADRRVETAGKGAATAAGTGADSAALADEGFGSGNHVATEVKLDPLSGDLLLTQSARSSAKGVAEVFWGLAGLRRDLAVIVPGAGGRRFGAPHGTGRLEWPIGWEAGMVILQGEKGGFWVWAEDPECAHFKSVELRWPDNRGALLFGSQNPAPFDDLNEVKSCVWHLGVYQGDWRVPARRYREWMTRAWGLRPAAEQRPTWVKDIRFVAIVGMETPITEALARAVDARATLLYVPGWRRDEYDRNYPDYTAAPEFGPFIKRAHELGFRVMPHVNYFGCDPKNELYAKFEPFQLTDPYSKEKLWWTWDRATPPIKFAYIDPACKEFRELFISRMVEAWKTYGFDALHLDQTLCIWNDHHGLMDGLNCAQGNRRLHRELREALPEVALSGEGLDEVTTQHEAFAQHHALGINFVEGTWDETTIDTAHPLRSYLLSPFTASYGYLGMTNPTNGPLYAAWREAYRHYGVLPTYPWPSPKQLEECPGFVGQVLAEAAFFVANKISPDLDGDWPPGVVFPYRAADGRRVAYVRDPRLGTLLVAERGGQRETISCTLHGVRSAELPGTIPGWRLYDEQRLLGLRPEAWYPYLNEPRDPGAFHVSRAAEAFEVTVTLVRDELAVISLANAEPEGGNLLTELDRAETGVRRYEGTEVRQQGPLSLGEPLQAHFVPTGTMFSIHPPWGPGPQGASGLGAAFAEFRVRVPTGPKPVFDSEVFMDEGAVAKTDGARFRVIARGPGGEREASVVNATAERRPLRLDLSAFAGREITLALEVDSGEARRADFDWARWSRPRVVCEGSTTAELEVVSPWTPQAIVFGGGPGELKPDPGRPNVYRLAGIFPGDVLLARQPSTALALPLDLTAAKWIFSAQTYGGADATNAQFVSAGAGNASCGGVSKPALNMHPPDQGVSRCDLVLDLPGQRAALTGFTGLRDGSKSEGARFIVEVNGRPLLSRHVMPSSWEPFTVDLAPCAGKTTILTFKVDAEGSFGYDWAAWGEPRLTAGNG